MCAVYFIVGCVGNMSYMPNDTVMVAVKIIKTIQFDTLIKANTVRPILLN